MLLYVGNITSVIIYLRLIVRDCFDVISASFFSSSTNDLQVKSY